MALTRTILVTAASGNIGTELVPLLVKKDDVKLVLPTRSASKLRTNVPASTSSNVTIEEGDIANPIWLESLLKEHDVDTVFLCLQGAGGGELDTTLNILDAMQRAGTVKQCVYVSICGDFVSPEGIERLTRNTSAGHVLVKIPIESKLKYGAFNFETTILGPTLFFSNDTRSKRALLDRGIFDEPLDRVSKVSPADIALAGRNVMFAPTGKYAGRKIQIGSRHVFSGAEIAALWTEALGKEVKMWGKGPEDMKENEKAHMKVVGSSFARDMRLMYEGFHAVGFGMSDEEYQEQVEVLGKQAEDYGAFVRTTARRWLEEEGKQ